MFFGNWYRPVHLMADSVAMGIQFLIGYENEGGTITREQWKAAARNLGLYYIIQAPPDEATFQAEALDPFCIGWNQHDEPNDASPTLTPIADMRANYVKWHATGKLVMCNFDGDQRWSGFDYASAYSLPVADIFFIDDYVRNRQGMLASITAVEQEAINRHKAFLKPGQKFGFFLETDNQMLSLQTPQWAPNGCGPTVADINEYFALAKANNIDMIALFEDVIGTGWVSFGNTQPDIAAAIKANIVANTTPISQLTGQVTGQIPAPPIVTHVDLPAAPTGLKITTKGKNIVASWNYPTQFVLGFQVLDGAGNLVATTGGSVVGVSFAAVAGTTTYYVKAFNAAGFSSQSNPVTITVATSVTTDILDGTTTTILGNNYRLTRL